MTDFELVDLWLSHWFLAMSVFVAFLSATSALIVFARISEGMLNVRTQMHEHNLQWFNAAYEPQFIAPVILTLGVIVQVALAIGSLWYFRLTHKSGR